MMDKQKNLYIVKSIGGNEFRTWATSSDKAKRIYCRFYGIKANDYWCGVRALTARKLGPEEIQAFELDNLI